MASGLIRILGGLPSSQSKNDDDAIDRLSHKTTASLLVVFSVVVTTKSYVGNSITCWIPKHFTGPWTKYAHQYCWVKGTHYVPLQPDVDIPKLEDEKDIIPYYQWIPIILLAQAFLFCVPRIVWRGMNSSSGVDVSDLIQASEVFHHAEKIDVREKTLNTITNTMHRFFMSGYREKPPLTLSLGSLFRLLCWPICGRHKSNYLVFLYVFVKLLYILNVIGQLFLLNYVLDTNFHSYGIDVMEKSLRGEEWLPTTKFPRVTMCDFRIRRLGALHRYVVQCALPVNLFNERVYLIIWFWFVFIAIVSCYSFVEWLVRGSIRLERHRYVRKHLKYSKKIKRVRSNPGRLARFVDKYLGPDGVMILKLISKNTDAYTVVDIISHLWDKFNEEFGEPEEDNYDPKKMNYEMQPIVTY